MRLNQGLRRSLGIVAEELRNASVTFIIVIVSTKSMDQKRWYIADRWHAQLSDVVLEASTSRRPDQEVYLVLEYF